MDTKPVKPNESDCCGAGCNPCIFDVYEEQLKKWENKQYSVQTSVGLNESKYLPFLITKMNIISSNIKFFEFQSVKCFKNYVSEVIISNAQIGVDFEIQADNLNIRSGHYLILRGQYETHENGASVIHNISRSYTPVLCDSRNGAFKVIVVIYPNGKMSKFLDKLKVNDIVFWRGPYQEFTYSTNSVNTLFLIGGGTGIIPLYNIAKEIVENDLEETTVICLASFKNFESFILRNEFQKLQDYWNFKMKVYITGQENTDCTPKYNENITFGRLTESILLKELSFHSKGKCLIVICGPDSFNKFIHASVLKTGVVKDVYVYK